MAEPTDETSNVFLEQVTNEQDLAKLVYAQRQYFLQGKTMPIGVRKDALRKLWHQLQTQEQEILAALKEDLGKDAAQAYLTEIGIVQNELKLFWQNLANWVKPKRVKTPLLQKPAKSLYFYSPYGVSLIFAPWNYPLQLALVPLIGAIGAGNTVVLVTSPQAPATAKVLQKILSAVFPREYVQVVDPALCGYEPILQQVYDYIFFTGSERIGKIVMEAATKNLTPLTLELGGKSPCIITPDADLAVAARRIVWGKLLNCGQTCVAPDYVLLPKDLEEKFVNLLQQEVIKSYGENPLLNPDYPAIINEPNFVRLEALVQSAKAEGKVVGGEADFATLKLAPAFIPSANPDGEAMQAEIFGPVLPIITCASVDEAISFLQGKPKPLALYIFTKQPQNYAKVLRHLDFGGCAINDTVVHLANPNLPFGGVGSSGMGQYHGKFSFTTFSHLKAVLKKQGKIDPSLRQPPYSAKELKLLQKLFGFKAK